MRTLTATITILIGVIIVVTWILRGSTSAHNAASPESVPQVRTSAAYRVDENRARMLIQGFDEIAVGDPKSRVLELLGAPDYVTNIARKERATAPVTGTILQWCLVRWEEGLVNNRKDDWLYVVIDLDNRVESKARNRAH